MLGQSNAAVLQLGASNQLPNGPGTGNLVFLTASGTSTFNLNGYSTTINGLVAAGAGIVTNSGSGTSLLTLGANNATASFLGTVTDSGTGKTLGITKIGTGTQTLGGVMTYNGATTVSGGTLAVASTGSIGASAIAVTSAGTLSILGTNGITGTSSLAISSGAAVTLSTANNYSGPTGVTGTLNINTGGAPLGDRGHRECGRRLE